MCPTCVHVPEVELCIKISFKKKKVNSYGKRHLGSYCHLHYGRSGILGLLRMLCLQWNKCSQLTQSRLESLCLTVPGTSRLEGSLMARQAVCLSILSLCLSRNGGESTVMPSRFLCGTAHGAKLLLGAVPAVGLRIQTRRRNWKNFISLLRCCFLLCF